MRRFELRVLNRGAQADARPAVRARASTVKKDAVRGVSGARQNTATIADNAKVLGKLFAQHAGSRDCDASGSTERLGRVYVMWIDNRARVTYVSRPRRSCEKPPARARTL
jgi:hypothetical protein